MKLEEIRIKVDFGVWTLEKGTEEMEKLPELAVTESKKILYKSTYEKWEAKQEKIVEEWRKKKEQGKGKGKEKGLEVNEEPEAEETVS